jgi:Subtilase family
MNDRPPPLVLNPPEILDRRPEAPRSFGSSPEAIANRDIKSQALRTQLSPVRREIGRLTPAQRRAFFIKLRHAGPINLTGTGLKQFSPPSDNVTLAVAQDDLSRLEAKITSYGSDPVKKGVIPNSALVGRLEEIEIGTPTDRLSDEMFESFEDLVAKQWVVVELEAVSLQTGRLQRREEIAQKLAQLDEFLGNGIRGTIYEHEEDGATSKIMIGCTGEALRSLIEDPEWQTVLSWFELPPAFETFHQTLRNFNVRDLGLTTRPADTSPVVCIVDSGVLPGNHFLEPVTRQELMHSFLKGRAGDLVDGFGHGSGVASLASYHEINLAPGADNAGQCWIASARILDENNDLNERLLSVVLEEVVRTFAPLGIRIFNLSVNIRNRPWNQSTRRIQPKRSWTARTIDKLSRLHDILFIVSVGNLAVDTVTSLHLERPYPSYFTPELCSILDPGQSALALSVGSLAGSAQIVGAAGTLTALAQRDQPSPFTRIGPGIRREHKPEVVEYGGNLAFDRRFRRVRENAGGSVVMASNALNPAITTSFGTSFAAPKVTFSAARILDDLQGLGVAPSGALLRAFLVSSATYPQSQQFLDALESLPVGTDYRDVVGYGIPSAFRATHCDEFSIVMYYQGALARDKVALFEVPVPEALSRAGRNPKTLSVTVAFDPDVHNRGFGEYFGTTLRWRLFRGDRDREEIVTLMSRPDEDGEDAARPAGDQRQRIDLLGAHGVQRRSRGTVQHDVEKWDEHQPDFSRNNYTLAITTFEKWNRPNPPPTRFAVVVRLEEHSHTIPIYDIVALALEAPVEVEV